MQPPPEALANSNAYRMQYERENSSPATKNRHPCSHILLEADRRSTGSADGPAPERQRADGPVPPIFTLSAPISPTSAFGVPPHLAWRAEISPCFSFSPSQNAGRSCRAVGTERKKNRELLIQKKACRAAHTSERHVLSPSHEEFSQQTSERLLEFCARCPFQSSKPTSLLPASRPYPPL